MANHDAQVRKTIWRVVFTDYDVYFDDLKLDLRIKIIILIMIKILKTYFEFDLKSCV